MKQRAADVLAYHSEMIIVATSAVREVARQGRLLTLLNRREISARRGLIVSGQQTTGKTTALKQLGRTHELMVRQLYPGRLADRIPVVYVTTPPKGSPRKLAMEFARFLGLPPVKRGYNTTDIADAVCQIMLAARVDLVLVDELHNLNLGTAGRGRHVRSPQILHRAPAGDLRLRRCCPPFGVSV